MVIKVDATSLRNRRSSQDLDGLPDQCPACHESIEPVIVTARLAGQLGASRVDVALQCPLGDCETLFVAQYNYKALGYRLARVILVAPPPAPFPDVVTDLSPTFGDIYSHALGAEAAGLSHLVGPGLRKALEFLVKDFATSQEADQSQRQRIGQMRLSDCISAYVTDPLVRETAHRAAWLGNDETHYARIWADKDITDLKELIRLVAAWVANHRLATRYLLEMPRA